MFQMTDAQVDQQVAVDAAAWNAVKNDYDPHGFFHTCDEHSNSYLTYCEACPEGEGNGKRTEEQLAAARAEWEAAVNEGLDEVPF
jgi:hypothetical protein